MVSLDALGEEMEMAKRQLRQGKYSREQFNDLTYRCGQVMSFLETKMRELEQVYDEVFPP